MKNNIQNLVKNVIDENVVRAKEHASNILYQKVGMRLQEEYLNVSRKLFQNLDEGSGGEDVGVGGANISSSDGDFQRKQQAPSEPPPQSAPSPDEKRSKYEWPKIKEDSDVKKAPRERTYFPEGLGPDNKPDPEKYELKDKDPGYLFDLMRWKQANVRWLERVKAYRNYWAKHAKQKN